MWVLISNKKEHTGRGRSGQVHPQRIRILPVSGRTRRLYEVAEQRKNRNTIFKQDFDLELRVDRGPSPIPCKNALSEQSHL
ncbi:hypothetical protein SeMB42_g04205 [Synchytrium endobioticum]|uniref:Uncharacterized protein n=1 Tax=Synchytrium endobioticum TaxID=286115 RepID=A0A507D0G8_9FUNG|nr:hypothetical protein SeMB42_g04205 [Synchytrium endobioticum]